MNSFSVSRVFNAPRSLVFDCWVTPEHFGKWGLLPAGCTPVLKHADVRPGGHYLIEQLGTDDSDLFVKFIFHEIDPIDRLVFVAAICTSEGEIITNRHFPSWPRTLLTTVSFEDAESGTRITVLWEPLDATDQEIEFFQENMDIGREGWSQSFDRLANVLKELRPANFGAPA